MLAQQVFFTQRDFQIGDGQRLSMDAWDGYVGFRDRNCNFIRDNGIQNPVVLTGDVQNNWAADLKANYDDPASKTLGSEFIGTSVTSGGDGADTSASQGPVVAENPLIKFFNGQRGYLRCTLTPEEWRADYRVLPYVKQPGAPIYTRASFVVEAGKPRPATGGRQLCSGHQGLRFGHRVGYGEGRDEGWPQIVNTLLQLFHRPGSGSPSGAVS